MKTNVVLAAISAAIISKIELANAPKKEEKKVEVEKDPRQDALDKLFSKADAFGGYCNQVREVVEAITGLTISGVTSGMLAERYVIVVPINNNKTGHYHVLGKPVVGVTKEGHFFGLENYDRIDGVYREETRPATEEEVTAFIAALKEDAASDTSKFDAFLNKFSLKSLAE